MANFVCMHMGTLIIDCEKPNCSGLYYDKFTDSVEQVALEMLALVNERDYKEGLRFALRLFALGVDTDEKPYEACKRCEKNAMSGEE